MLKSELVRKQQAEISSKVKGSKLASLTALDRVDIAESLVGNTKWRKIGLCFETSHKFKKSYTELKADIKDDNDSSLCEHLIEELSRRGITVPELAEALRNKSINMHAIADELMERYSADVTSETTDVDTSSDAIPLINGSVTYRFPDGQELSYLFSDQTFNELSNDLKANRAVQLQSSIADRLALEYCYKTRNYSHIIQLNCATESLLIKDLKELAAWFRIPVSRAVFEDPKDFFGGQVWSQLDKRLKQCKTLLVLSQVSAFNGVNTADRMLKLQSSICHILVLTNSLFKLKGALDAGIYVHKPKEESSWIDKKCLLFLNLMSFAEQNSILESVIIHSEQFKSNALQPLIKKDVVNISSDREISISVQYKAGQYNPTDMMRKWIEILQSTNHLPMSYKHFEKKLALFAKLSAHNSWPEIEQVLKMDFLNAFIEFLGFWQGEYYNTEWREFQFYHFQSYHIHLSLLEALINMHPPQGRYSQSSQPSRESLLQKARLAANEFEEEKDSSITQRIIAHYCYSHYLKQEPTVLPTNNTNEDQRKKLAIQQKNRLESLNQLTFCDELIAHGTLHENHPLVISVYFLQAIVQYESRTNDLSTLSSKFSSICSSLTQMYQHMDNHPALTEARYYLGMALIREEKWHESVKYFEQSIKGQLQNDKLASYTLHTVAGLLKCYEEHPSDYISDNSKFDRSIDRLDYWRKSSSLHRT